MVFKAKHLKILKPLVSGARLYFPIQDTLHFMFKCDRSAATPSAGTMASVKSCRSCSEKHLWRKKQTTCPTSPEVWGCNIHAKLGNLGISAVESSLEQYLALWMIEIGTFGSIAISMLKGWPMPPAPPTTQTCKMRRNVSLFEIRGHTWPDLPKRNLAWFPKGPKAKCNRTLYFPITMSTGCDNTIVERTAAHSTCRSSQIRPWSFLPWLHTETDGCVSKWLQVLADVMQKPWHATCYIRLLLDSQSIIYSSCFIWIYFMYVSSVPYI